MPFLLLLPPAGMDDCGVLPHFIGSDEVLEGCADSAEAVRELEGHDRWRGALSDIAARVRGPAVHELGAQPAGLGGSAWDLGLVGPEAIQLMLAAEPQDLEAFIDGLGAADALPERVAHVAGLILHQVFPQLARAEEATRNGQPDAEATATFGGRPLGPPLASLLGHLLLATGALELPPDEFMQFLEVCDLGQDESQRCGLAMSATEIYLQHTVFGSSEASQGAVR